MLAGLGCAAGALAWTFLSGSSSGDDASGGAVEHGAVTFDVSPSGRQVVFSSAGADLYLLDLVTRRVRSLVRSADAEEYAPAFSPDGRFVAYVRAGAKGGTAAHVFLRPLAGTGPGRQLTRGEDTCDAAPAFSADGRQIVFARAYRRRRFHLIGDWIWDDWDVCRMQRDGTQFRRLTHAAYYSLSAPRLSRDGASALYAANGDNSPARDFASTVFRVSAQNGGGAAAAAAADAATAPRPIFAEPPAGAPYHGAAWAAEPNLSRNGRRLVFIADRVEPFFYDLWVANADGTVPRPLGVTGASRYNSQPAFLPDGSVLFLAGTQWNQHSRPIYELWRANTRGPALPRKVAGSELFTDPARWKP